MHYDVKLGTQCGKRFKLIVVTQKLKLSLSTTMSDSAVTLANYFCYNTIYRVMI